MKTTHLVFPVLFATLSLIPLARFDARDVSERENRRLETWPSWTEFRWQTASAWFRRAEAAFGDRFFGRYAFVEVRTWLLRVLRGHGGDRVSTGRDGWLFYTATLTDFANVTHYDDGEKETIAAQLNKLARRCREKGKGFVFLIAPDKCRIYPEKVLGWQKTHPDFDSRTEDLVAYLRRRCDFPVLYPRERLLNLRDRCRDILYFKQDTHWTPLGAYFGAYLDLVDAFSKVGCSVDPVAEPEWTNDLGELAMRGLVNAHGLVKMLPPGAVDPLPVDSVSPKFDRLQMTLIGDRPRWTSSCPTGRKRLFALHDSFAKALMPFLGRTFSQVTFRWARDLRPADEADFDACDVLLMEVVERNVGRLLTGDWKPPTE